MEFTRVESPVCNELLGFDRSNHKVTLSRFVPGFPALSPITGVYIVIFVGAVERGSIRFRDRIRFAVPLMVFFERLQNETYKVMSRTCARIKLEAFNDPIANDDRARAIKLRDLIKIIRGIQRPRATGQNRLEL